MLQVFVYLSVCVYVTLPDAMGLKNDPLYFRKSPGKKWINYCNFSIPINICILYVYIPRICFSSSDITLLAFVAWPAPFVIVYMAIRVVSTRLQLALSQDAQITVQPIARPSQAPTVWVGARQAPPSSSHPPSPGEIPPC